MLQVGDLCCNADIKIALKSWYARWKTKELSGRSVGHTKLKLPRDELIAAMEEVFKKFNMSQRRNPVVKKTFMFDASILLPVHSSCALCRTIACVRYFRPDLRRCT